LLNGKTALVLSTYLSAVRREGVLNEFLIIIKKADDKEELRNFLKKRLGLPLGNIQKLITMLI